MRSKLLMIVFLVMLVIAGCGGPKEDLTIFVMGPQGVPAEVGDKLEASLVAKLGPTPTIGLNTSPMFSMEKMIVEIAAGENGIIVLGEEQWKALGNQGGYVSLDDVVNPDEHKDGVLTITEEGKSETHVYGIHLVDTKWMKELELNGKGLFAFIPANAKNMELSKQVMKVIAEK
jgi:ABC-type glycerol-3-phosphate transport system substrate-binding protein